MTIVAAVSLAILNSWFFISFYCFTVCFVLGWVISFWSIINSGSVFGNPGRFAMCYSLGNVVSIFSTMFLWGPCAQLQSMYVLVYDLSHNVMSVFLVYIES